MRVCTYGFDNNRDYENRYLANSPLVSQISFTNGSQHRMVTTKQFDLLNRLSSATSCWTPAPTSQDPPNNGSNHGYRHCLSTDKLFSSILSLASVGILLSTTGSSTSGCRQKPPAAATGATGQWLSPKEQSAIRVVKLWYVQHGYKIPARIVVQRTVGKQCMLSAGPEHIECGFAVDLDSMKVVSFTPGE